MTNAGFSPVTVPPAQGGMVQGALSQSHFRVSVLHTQIRVALEGLAGMQ